MPRVSSDRLTAGQTFTFHAIVRNIGRGPSGSTALNYSRWRPDEERWVREKAQAVPRLSAREAVRKSTRLRARSSPGTYYYRACVRYHPSETDGANNCSDAVRVSVRRAARPDLVVPGVRVDDTSLIPDQAFTFHATVANLGGAAAPATRLDLFARPSDDENWQHQLDRVIARLGPGERVATSFGLEAPTTEGAYFLIACVRTVDREANGDNNCSDRVRVAVAGVEEGCTQDLGTVLNRTRTIHGSWTGACRSVHYSGGEYARYYSFTVPGSTRSAMTIDLTSPSVDTWLALYTGGGTGNSRIDQDNDGGDGTNARIRRTLGPGTYTVEATTLRGGVRGPYTLRLAPFPVD